MNEKERTLVIIKPDGVTRNLIGDIISRYEIAGLRVCAMKMTIATESIAALQYREDEDFLRTVGVKIEKAGVKVTDYVEEGRKAIRSTREYLMEGPVVPVVLEGPNAVEKAREVNGYTDPSKAEKGTIRRDFGQDDILTAHREHRSIRNIVHASGNREEAEREIPIWFNESEIYKTDDKKN